MYAKRAQLSSGGMRVVLIRSCATVVRSRDVGLPFTLVQLCTLVKVYTCVKMFPLSFKSSCASKQHARNSRLLREHVTLYAASDCQRPASNGASNQMPRSS
ncbi:hypothetical protein IQ06DRAFT_81161 [Phaeosphaeriaceae sp. SRC1lsM3a]|nr:hypothetical protein IQ06DRAFT_81161 [Stagonospora sp. SRC1lsM3a]